MIYFGYWNVSAVLLIFFLLGKRNEKDEGVNKRSGEREMEEEACLILVKWNVCGFVKMPSWFYQILKIWLVFKIFGKDND